MYAHVSVFGLKLDEVFVYENTPSIIPYYIFHMEQTSRGESNKMTLTVNKDVSQLPSSLFAFDSRERIYSLQLKIKL